MNNKKVLYTGGTFDLFHYGHINFLQKCRMISDEVIVSLNTDEFIFEYKGNTPVMTYEERKKSLLSCPYVDRVIPNIGGKDSRVSILEINPDIVAIGDDWAKKDYYKQMSFTQEWLDEHNIVLVYIPYTQGISTTEIKNRLLTQKGKL
jgi:glycerol-3-phosphate cytidylyltransferase